MKTRITSTYAPPLLRAVYAFLIAIAALAALPGTAHSQQDLYVAHLSDTGGDGVVSEYLATSGSLIKADFITGLRGPAGLAISGNTLYV